MKKLLPVLVAMAVAVLGLAQPSAGLPSAASPTAEAHTHGPDGLELDRRGRRPTAAAPYAVDDPVPWRVDGHDRQALT